MKQILINELKKCFQLKKEENLVELAESTTVKSISGLSALIKSLTESTASPKEITQQVEDVLVCIAMKNKPTTDLEKSLTTALSDYQKKLQTGEIEIYDSSRFTL